MKTWNQKVKTWRGIFLLIFLLTHVVHAQPGPISGGYGPTNTPLDSWTFYDSTNWTSDLGYAPLSFTNLSFSRLGDGQSLVVDTNVPAWLQYRLLEGDGTTNLTVQSGSVTFWFAPNWSSADDTNGGSGPQEYGRLFEAGGFTTNSSYGWWSIYVDSPGENIYFGAQTNDGLGRTYALWTPIDWTTNYFHFVALTYSPTNVSLYLDGLLATNDPGGLNIWPGMNVLSNGFWMGSDSNGIDQAEGMFNSVATYNYPLDSNDVENIYQWEQGLYLINIYNIPFMDALSSAPSSPSTSPADYDAITGQGMLQSDVYIGPCANGTNSYNAWITNVTASAANNGSITFTIEGGSNDVPFDVFANSVLSFGTNGFPWVWEGQGYQCNTYTITNVGSSTCYLILGTPQDTDGDGLTDAYELLVSKSSVTNTNSSGDGLSDAWDVLLGLSVSTNQNAQPSTRSNFSYNPIDWWSGVSGIRSGTNSTDAEGNILTVSE